MKKKIFLLPIAWTLAACMPFPVPRTPDIVGSVRDRATLQPISSARLHYSQYPSRIVSSSADGSFNFPRVREWLIVIPGVTDLRPLNLILIVDADGYETEQVRFESGDDRSKAIALSRAAR